ncbi:hypothetical protein D3C72_680300 [compost metagenome]
MIVSPSLTGMAAAVWIMRLSALMADAVRSSSDGSTISMPSPDALTWSVRPLAKAQSAW